MVFIFRLIEFWEGLKYRVFFRVKRISEYIEGRRGFFLKKEKQVKYKMKHDRILLEREIWGGEKKKKGYYLGELGYVVKVFKKMIFALKKIK